MAPVLNHPTSVTFVDDANRSSVNVDAATYYGGGEVYTRSRTYSHVSHGSMSVVSVAHTTFTVSYSWV